MAAQKVIRIWEVYVPSELAKFETELNAIQNDALNDGQTKVYDIIVASPVNVHTHWIELPNGVENLNIVKTTGV